ncbi:MAG: IS630 family transposase, partial [Castellaniella sp.]
MSKPAAPFTLPATDRTELRAWLRKTTLDQRLAQRARILLDLDAAVPPARISERLGLSAPVV